jgi:hypothetical protein
MASKHAKLAKVLKLLSPWNALKTDDDQARRQSYKRRLRNMPVVVPVSRSSK